MRPAGRSLPTPGLECQVESPDWNEFDPVAFNDI